MHERHIHLFKFSFILKVQFVQDGGYTVPKKETQIEREGWEKGIGGDGYVFLNSIATGQQDAQFSFFSKKN